MVLPVLDLMKQRVVRGVAGLRQSYRPVVSRLTPAADPLTVARAFRAHFGLTRLYLADLDAIAGAAPAVDIYAALQQDGFRLWVDAGLRELHDVAPLVAVGVEGIVAGLETLAGPRTLHELCGAHGDRIVFSLDLKGGRPLGDGAAWETADAWEIIVRAIACGVRRPIVLDLARVGVSAGPGTEDLCRRLKQAYPQLEVIAGGGVRDVADLRRLKESGVWGVLIASALHDGRLRPEDLVGL